MQRAFDPFAGAGKTEDGTITMDIEEVDLKVFDLTNEEKNRKLFENYKNNGDIWEAEDEGEMTYTLQKELEL
jgi:hypothetical protein